MNETEKTKVLILGFGVEGQATLHYLQNSFLGSEFAVADRREIKNDELEMENENIKCFFGKDYLKKINEYDLIIKSPGIKPDLPELLKFKKHGGRITSATNIFMSQVKGSVVSVTGSKGKSTVSSLLYAVLKQSGKKVSLIGNIGNPALDALENDSKESFYVYEMSSYQLEDLEKKPQYAFVNNLFPEHLDYHGSLAKYYEAKMNIIAKPSNYYQGALKQKVFYNAGSENLVEKIQEKTCQKIPFNDAKDSKIKDNKLIYKGEEIIDTKEVKLLGKHNLENILGVITVAKELGIETETIRKAVREFKNLEHRLEYVGEFQRINFYNDSISTTPESTIQAIESLGKNLETLIVGGLDRGYNFEELAKVILKSKIRNLILFPETGERIKTEILRQAEDDNLNFYKIDNMQDCVKKSFAITRENKICLLSPASPSYNLFKNFIERGNVYKNFIQINK